MSCRCGGQCAECQNLGSYMRVPPAQYPGYRLRLPGGASQFHGRLGVYRGPAEPPPNPNPGAGLGVVAAPVLTRTVCPAWGCETHPMWGPIRYPYPSYPLPRTSTTPQPPPSDYPASAPVVSSPPQCPSPNSFVDAAGNCVSDWHNPYSLYLPASPVPANTVAADTAQNSTAAQAPASSWFTDPVQELISGVPNWAIVAAAGAFFLMRGRR